MAFDCREAGWWKQAVTVFDNHGLKDHTEAATNLQLCFESSFTQWMALVTPLAALRRNNTDRTNAADRTNAINQVGIDSAAVGIVRNHRRVTNLTRMPTPAARGHREQEFHIVRENCEKGLDITTNNG